MEVINEGSYVILCRGSYMKSCKINTSKTVLLGKKRDGFQLDLGNSIGQPFGSTFRLVPNSGKNKSVGIERMALDDIRSNTFQHDGACGDDNRNLIDAGTSQQLTKEEIKKMQAAGASGEEVLQAITSSSTTFSGKTKYSQEKYVNKKSKKYMEPITLLKPTLDLVAEMLYVQEPPRISNLRMDTLFQMLCQSNLYPGGKAVIFDSSTLLLATAGALQRLGPKGKLVSIFMGDKPWSNVEGSAVKMMDFTEAELSCVSHISIHDLHSVDRGDTLPSQEVESKDEAMSAVNKRPHDSDGDINELSPLRKKPASVESEVPSLSASESSVTQPSIVPQESEIINTEKGSSGVLNGSTKKIKQCMRSLADNLRESRQVLSEGVHSMLIACRQHPLEPTLALLPFLLPGCPFAVYSPYSEPLLEVYQSLKANGATNLKLSETWLREYQVLPERTHPLVNMSGGGGYLLCGTKISQ